MAFSRFDKIIQPKAIEYLRSKGYKVEADNEITHDILVEGKKVECKFMQSVYQQFYIELYNCSDCKNCKDCNPNTQKDTLLGWGHRESYCKADYIQLYHCRKEEIVQIATVKKEPFLDWLWDVHFAQQKTHTMITSWEGKHRTIGVAIPFNKIPEHLINIERL